MGDPRTTYESPFNGAIGEAISAMSSLNMNADPIPGAEGYLSETDGWAKHAMEHLNAVVEQCRKASELYNKLRDRNARKFVADKDGDGLDKFFEEFPAA